MSKYLILGLTNGTTTYVDHVVVFSASVSQRDMAARITANSGYVVMSAGEVRFNHTVPQRFNDPDVAASCVKGSVSLGIPFSREGSIEDAETLRIFLLST